MINRVVLVGRLTKDIEVRKTQTGLSVTSFTVACNRKSTNGNSDADFINCTAWRQAADFLGSYAKKGALIGVEGRIGTSNYTNNAGVKVYVTEVVCDQVQLLESKSKNQGNDSSYNNNYGNNSNSNTNSSYQNKDYSNQSSSFTQNDPGMSQDNSFDDVPSLDISSDDLPF
jgi:single-strand DNA-binding protein